MSEHSHLIEENILQSTIDFKYKVKLDGISESSEFYCLHCKKPDYSYVEYTYSKSTYIWCFILCLCTIIFGLIPFCVRKCQSKTHFCPNCHKQVGFTEGEFC